MSNLLDLGSLPAALQTPLVRLLPCDESRRRAVLAPWLAVFGEPVIDHPWPWEPLKRFWREADAAQVRARFEAYLCRTLHPGAARSLSIFDPGLPFFPCALTQATHTWRSPWPGVFTNAEYWAITMQLFNGDPAHADELLQGWVLREGPHGRLIDKQLSPSERRHLIAEIWDIEIERRTGYCV